MNLNFSRFFLILISLLCCVFAHAEPKAKSRVSFLRARVQKNCEANLRRGEPEFLTASLQVTEFLEQTFSRYPPEHLINILVNHRVGRPSQIATKYQDSKVSKLKQKTILENKLLGMEIFAINYNGRLGWHINYLKLLREVEDVNAKPLSPELEDKQSARSELAKFNTELLPKISLSEEAQEFLAEYGQSLVSLPSSLLFWGPWVKFNPSELLAKHNINVKNAYWNVFRMRTDRELYLVRAIANLSDNEVYIHQFDLAYVNNTTFIKNYFNRLLKKSGKNADDLAGSARVGQFELIITEYSAMKAKVFHQIPASTILNSLSNILQLQKREGNKIVMLTITPNRRLLRLVWQPNGRGQYSLLSAYEVKSRNVFRFLNI